MTNSKVRGPISKQGRQDQAGVIAPLSHQYGNVLCSLNDHPLSKIPAHPSIVELDVRYSPVIPAINTNPEPNRRSTAQGNRQAQGGLVLCFPNTNFNAQSCERVCQTIDLHKYHSACN
jgi:hypothetical protein